MVDNDTGDVVVESTGMALGMTDLNYNVSIDMSIKEKVKEGIKRAKKPKLIDADYDGI